MEIQENTLVTAAVCKYGADESVSYKAYTAYTCNIRKRLKMSVVDSILLTFFCCHSPSSSSNDFRHYNDVG